MRVKKEKNKCIVCGTPVKLNKHTTCSRQCREAYKKINGLFDISKEKQIKTNLERYGFEHPAKSKRVQEKRVATMIQKYGCGRSEKGKESSRKFMKELANRNKEILLKKYGVENPSQIPGWKEKCKKTLIKHYGVDNYHNSEEWKQKSFKKMLEHYKKVVPNNIIVNNLLPPSEELKEQFAKPNWRISYSCQIHNISEELPSETFKFRLRETGTPCSKCSGISTAKSFKEIEISNFVKSLGLFVIENDRKIISPYELDIVIPSHKIAIEFCGLFWHSKESMDRKYHLEKLEKCKEKGYALIQIFEDEWDHHSDIVKLRLQHILGMTSNKIFARKCKIKEISSKEYKMFVNTFHIQGYIPSKIKLGLFYNNELVSIMSFSKPRISKGKNNTGFELDRFCSKIHVVGGASKLFSYFIKNYNPDVVYSFSDNRWGQGNVYSKLGFTFKHNSPPNYWYIEGSKRYHRYSLRKQSTEPKDKTEWELRQAQGYRRIWDCGHAKYIWEKK